MYGSILLYSTPSFTAVVAEIVCEVDEDIYTAHCDAYIVTSSCKSNVKCLCTSTFNQSNYFLLHMSAWIFGYLCPSIVYLPVSVTYIHSLRGRLQPLHVRDAGEAVACVLHLQEPQTEQEGKRRRLEKEHDRNLGVE